ncbi:putative cytidylate kinase [Desulforapulum autotrophicum HRM2]|uniref:Cytidylate kinase n=2 Tax=Desulforapulum autotrophicum TaxID=2296 RepID=C0QL80_DESAH|nr:putative cytidylate kinase [Desulforapulum autotrophicum HRM2]
MESLTRKEDIMNDTSESMVYKPGQYRKKRLSVSEWSNAHIRNWADKQRKDAAQELKEIQPDAICFSRKIGVGALEIADLVAQKINFRVVDREILEHMAADANLTQRTVAFFDERYPGKMSDLMAMLIKEKSFMKNDYARQLAKSVVALANLEPTLFVGRGAHLLLPREKVLAVRFICSLEFRVKRLAKELGIPDKDAETRLKKIDEEQRKFFKTVYDKKDASPYEFDLVINRDYITDAAAAAEIVAAAHGQKFKQI